MMLDPGTPRGWKDVDTFAAETARTPPAEHSPDAATSHDGDTLLTEPDVTTSGLVAADSPDVFSEAETEQSHWAQKPSAPAER